MESVRFGVVFVVFMSGCSLWAFPVIPETDQTEIFKEYFNDTNGTAHDLYVIRTIIYEVGILTDADNDTDYSNETHEQVDLTFYDPEHNDTAINLSNIPIPVQTNFSGQIITGIAPANFGIIPLPSSENETNSMGYSPFTIPLMPSIVLRHTSNISTTDPEEEKKIIEGLPEELGV